MEAGDGGRGLWWGACSVRCVFPCLRHGLWRACAQVTFIHGRPMVHGSWNKGEMQVLLHHGVVGCSKAVSDDDEPILCWHAAAVPRGLRCCRQQSQGYIERPLCLTCNVCCLRMRSLLHASPAYLHATARRPAPPHRAASQRRNSPAGLHFASSTRPPTASRQAAGKLNGLPGSGIAASLAAMMPDWLGVASAVVVGAALVGAAVQLLRLAFADADLNLLSKGPHKANAFENKVVWITGASQGLGEVLAKYFARHGARLILSSRDAEKLGRVKAACALPDSQVRRGRSWARFTDSAGRRVVAASSRPSTVSAVCDCACARSERSQQHAYRAGLCHLPAPPCPMRRACMQAVVLPFDLCGSYADLERAAAAADAAFDGAGVDFLVHNAGEANSIAMTPCATTFTCMPHAFVGAGPAAERTCSRSRMTTEPMPDRHVGPCGSAWHITQPTLRPWHGKRACAVATTSSPATRRPLLQPHAPTHTRIRVAHRAATHVRCKPACPGPGDVGRGDGPAHAAQRGACVRMRMRIWAFLCMRVCAPVDAHVLFLCGYSSRTPARACCVLCRARTCLVSAGLWENAGRGGGRREGEGCLKA